MPAHEPRCWGLAASNGLSPCDRSFVPRGGQVKRHFCSVCTSDGVAVPAERVRALTDEQVRHVSKPSGRGFYKAACTGVGGGGFVRVVNNTITCDGPWLAVFRSAPSESTTFSQIPAHWLNDGHVVFAIAKHTLVPMAAMTGAPPPPGDNVIPKAKRRLGERVGGQRRAVVSSDKRPCAWLYAMIADDA